MLVFWSAGDLARAANRIEPGDIVGTTIQTIAGASIWAVQRMLLSRHASAAGLSRIVHVAVSLGGLDIVEAMPNPGVRTTTLGGNGECVVLRPAWPDATAPARVRREALRQLGSPYSLVPLHILQAALRRLNIPGALPPEVFVCSTFLVGVFANALQIESPFNGASPASRMPFFLPADVVAVPKLGTVRPF